MTGEEKKLLAEKSRESVRYMCDGIEHVCRNVKKRGPGSDGEKEAASYMAEVLKNECGCEEVKTETFSLHPSAFYGYFRFSAFFDTLSCIGFFIHPIVSIVSASVALFLFVFQFLLYKEIIDPLFPVKESVNVTGVIKPRGEVKRRVFLNGHIDAAWEFTLNNLFGGVVFEIPGLLALIGVIYYIVLSVLKLAGTEGLLVPSLVGIVFVPFFLLVAVTSDPKNIVDGANDNLSGCYMGIALLKAMKENTITLENTEIGVILTGSEEAGLKGAKAWCEKHKDEYCDVPTYVISYDTIHDPKELMVNYRDLNGIRKADRWLGDVFMLGAKRAGVSCRKGMVPPFGGATDSAAFTEAGFRAVGITGLNHKLEDYYHTRRDSYDNLDCDGLDACYRATVETIDIIDGEGEET